MICRWAILLFLPNVVKEQKPEERRRAGSEALETWKGKQSVPRCVSQCVQIFYDMSLESSFLGRFILDCEMDILFCNTVTWSLETEP